MMSSHQREDAFSFLSLPQEKTPRSHSLCVCLSLTHTHARTCTPSTCSKPLFVLGPRSPQRRLGCDTAPPLSSPPLPPANQRQNILAIKHIAAKLQKASVFLRTASHFHEPGRLRCLCGAAVPSGSCRQEAIPYSVRGKFFFFFLYYVLRVAGGGCGRGGNKG